MLLNPLGGRVGDGGDGRAAPGEEHQARAAVVGVRTAFDVARALELIDRLRHGLLAHPGEVGELRDGDAFGRHEREDVRGCGTDVLETRLAQRGIDVLGVVLVEEAEQKPDHWTGRKVGLHGNRQVPVHVGWTGT